MANEILVNAIFNIEKAIKENKKVIATYKEVTRTSAYGKFVKHADHEELLRKNMMRFVSESKMDLYENFGQKVEFTSIINLSLIKFVRNAN